MTDEATTRNLPPLNPRLELARAVMMVVLILSASLLLQLVLVSRLQESAAQQRAYDHFRAKLAEGTAPIGPTDSDGDPLAHGTPVAYLEIPSIGLKQVVVEGTAPSDLFDGPGHRRDTPLPGQVGTSVVYGRRAVFGGSFSRINQLREGDLIRVTTGQGSFQYKVLGVRREGDPIPVPLASGSARLTMATADGRSFMPNGVLRVDADIDGTPVGGPARELTAAALPVEERLMANDLRTLWVLALWLQALLVVALGAVWTWQRWGRAQAWVVFVPVLLLVGLYVWGEFARLLPNLA